ncbi:MAG: phage tail family protein [Clostridium sp.]
MDIKLILKSNNKTLDIAKSTSYKLVNIDGIERANLELNTASNAQFDGSVIIGRRIQNRPISITVDYKGENKEIERQKLISFFNPKNKGVLIAEYGGIERAIEYEIEDFNCQLTNIHDDLSFTVDLICHNPYWRNIVESKINIALWKGIFKFPLIITQNIGIVMGLREPSLIVNVLNIGDVESGMIIEFKALGTLKNPSLLNVNTGEFLKINKSMVSGEIIKVNTNVGNKKVIKDLNGIETNILNLIDLDSTFLQLNVGDNLFRYNADENLNNLEISIYYNPYYLGV